MEILQNVYLNAELCSRCTPLPLNSVLRCFKRACSCFSKSKNFAYYNLSGLPQVNVAVKKLCLTWALKKRALYYYKINTKNYSPSPLSNFPNALSPQAWNIDSPKFPSQFPPSLYTHTQSAHNSCFFLSRKVRVAEQNRTRRGQIHFWRLGSCACHFRKKSMG